MVFSNMYDSKSILGALFSTAMAACGEERKFPAMQVSELHDMKFKHSDASSTLSAACRGREAGDMTGAAAVGRWAMLRRLTQAPSRGLFGW